MSRISRHKPSPAMVVSIVALVVALGGTSYAAVVLPRNSVSSSQIKPRGVKTSDIGDSVVTSGKVRDGSMLAKDFRPGQLVAGARGPKGDTGPRGAAGTAGTNAATHVVARVSAVAGVGPGGVATAVATCLPGERATGGGGFSGNSETIPITSSTPGDGAAERPAGGTVATQWIATGFNDSGSSSFVQAYVMCSAP